MTQYPQAAVTQWADQIYATRIEAARLAMVDALHALRAQEAPRDALSTILVTGRPPTADEARMQEHYDATCAAWRRLTMLRHLFMTTDAPLDERILS